MYIADLHIHSSYSRATAKNITPEVLELWGRKKGIGLIGTGDFTHPAWRRELSEKLTLCENGLYRLKDEYVLEKGKYSLRPKHGKAATEDEAGGINTTDIGEEKPNFVITGEISSIYKQGDRVRKVHSLIILPSLKDAEKISAKLETIGNIHSDGRPILGLPCRDLAEIVFELCPKAIYIPAHVWTPHFSMFGAFSGFDSVEECFGDMSPEIHAVETGLSSDPLMNRRVSMLDKYQLISDSDAHSPAKLGREATVFDTELSYESLYTGIQTGAGLHGTIEFYPEEGKYHLDGHRKCHLSLTPSETKKYGGICPVCGKKITVGVLHRVEELADRGEDYISPDAKPFESLMPLNELIGASWGKSSESTKVKECYEKLIDSVGPEFYILRDAPSDVIRENAGDFVAEGIKRLREGKVILKAGFDGEYGKVGLFTEDELKNARGQMSFFFEETQRHSKDDLKTDADEVIDKDTLEMPGMSIPSGMEADNKGLNPGSEKCLNERQLMAVKSVAKVTAVSAGPGTGKTSTLTAAIIYRIKERGVQPSEITAFTFTRKAAEELKERLRHELKGKARFINVGTIHGICLKLLKESGSVMETADEFLTKEYVEDTVERFGLGMKNKDFLRELSLIKNKVKGYETIPEEAVEFYSEKLRKAGLMDFDDILINTCSLVKNGSLKSGKKRHFSYLFVDELQDTGPLEYEAIKALSEGSKEVFLIGDSDQSIYGFRGASADCFERLNRDYNDIELIRLDRNYRSERDIVLASRAFISNNPGGEREMIPAAGLNKKEKDEYIPNAFDAGLTGKNEDKEEAGIPTQRAIEVVKAESELSSAIFIARKINELVGGIDMLDRDLRGAGSEKPRGFSDIAVLYRSNYQAGLIERVLRKEGIPYIVSGREDYLLCDSVRGSVLFFKYVLYNDNQAGELSLKILSELEKNTLSEAVLKNMRKKFLELSETKKPSELLSIWSEDMSLSGDENIEKLIGISVFYSDMGAFLDDLSMGEESDIYRVGGKEYTFDAVRLSTVHGAKGLEFPVVFIAGAEEGRFPRKDDFEYPEELFEERRIFFVAMTRAKEKLYINTVEGKESQFISELPCELYEMNKASAFTKADRKKRLAKEQGVQMSIFDFIK